MVILDDMFCYLRFEDRPTPLCSAASASFTCSPRRALTLLLFLSDVYFSAICEGYFVYPRLAHLIDWILGVSQKDFELAVAAAGNDVLEFQTYFLSRPLIRSQLDKCLLLKRLLSFAGQVAGGRCIQSGDHKSVILRFYRALRGMEKIIIWLIMWLKESTLCC